MFTVEEVTNMELITCAPDNCSPDYSSTPYCGPDDSGDPNDDR